MAFNSNDIYTGNKYLKNNPDWGEKDTEWKAGIINSLLQKNNIHPVTVADVGCGAGGVLYHLLKKNPGIEKLQGYDISREAIEMALPKASPKLSFYQENYLLKPAEYTDLLLCIDVIEHVDDVYGFVSALTSKAKYFVFHIPLDLSGRTVLKPHVMQEQRKSVGHIHYFTKHTAAWLLEDCGCRIIDWVYTKPVTDWEPSNSFKQGVKKMLRNFSFALNKDISAKLWGGYSIMVLAENKNI